MFTAVLDLIEALSSQGEESSDEEEMTGVELPRMQLGRGAPLELQRRPPSPPPPLIDRRVCHVHI